MRPRLIHAWVDEQGNVIREDSPRSVRRVISEQTASTLRTMLTAVVEYGTAREIKHPTITIAGKTGTAEKIDEMTGKYIPGKFNSSFVGMAPAQAPSMVCLVLLDEPSQLKYGGQSAAPIFREILDRLALEWNWTPSGQAVAQSQAERVPIEHKTSSSQVQGALTNRVMPDLQNSTLRDALQRLMDLGVQVDYEGEGKVMGQDPAPGTPLYRGIRCRLTLGWMG